jgi:Flp pilus assembly protein TadB
LLQVIENDTFFRRAAKALPIFIRRLKKKNKKTKTERVQKNSTRLLLEKLLLPLLLQQRRAGAEPHKGERTREQSATEKLLLPILLLSWPSSKLVTLNVILA